MTEQELVRQRWRELAEQLGLPPDPESEPEVPTPPPAPPAAVAEPPEEERAEPEPVSLASPVIEPEHPVEEPAPARGRRRRGPAAETPPVEVPTAEEVPPEPMPSLPASPEATGSPEEEPLEIPPPGGRKRGRRGSRSSRAEGSRQRTEPVDSAVTEAPAESPPSEEGVSEEAPAERQRRRGRGRGRHKKTEREKPPREEKEEETVSSEEEEVVTEQGGQTEAELDEGDQSDDVASNWNVPTWQELIASLYRPER
jgi:hypothetical protein